MFHVKQTPLFWDMDGQGNFVVRLLTAAPGVYTGGLHDGQTLFHRVEEQADVPKAVDGRRSARSLLLTAQPLNIRLCLGHVKLVLYDVLKSGPLELPAVQPQKRPCVALGETDRPQAVDHILGQF